MADRVTQARHGTATGGRVTISLPGFALGRPATSHAIGLIGDERQEFVTGIRRFAGWAAREGAGVALDLSYTMTGGTLRAGTTSAPGAPNESHTAVAWTGRRWSLYMFSASATPETLIDVLGLVDLDEERDGLVVRPRHRELRWEAPAQLTKEIPELGLLDVAAMHGAIRRRIPRWAGTRARGGEVYVDRSNPDQTVYTVANETSATRVLPHHRARRAALQRGLGRVRVTHQDAGRSR